MPVIPIDTDQIVITASRVPEAQAAAPASVTIIDDERIERLGEPLVPDLLRLVPSTVGHRAPGRPGSLTEVRIRGAEANHTLLFIDGIRANDPATGNQPRFDLLNADIASRIEVVRGPQSALWGSDAIGGVVAVNGAGRRAGYRRAAEGGSFGFGARLPRSARPATAKPRRRASAGSARPGSTASTATATRMAIATSPDGFAAPASSLPTSSLAPLAFASDRAQRIRRLRSGHLPARRHARQQPQPAGGAAGSGRSSGAKRRPWSGQRQQHRCSVRPTATISRTSPQSHQRHAPDVDAQVEHRFATGR